MRRLLVVGLLVAACSATVDGEDAGSGGGAASGGGGGGSQSGGGGMGGAAGGFIIMAGGGGGTATGGGATGGGNAGPIDAGPTGTATLSGSLGFAVHDARAVVGLRFDGGVSLTSVKIAMADQLVGNPCTGTGAQGIIKGLLVSVATGDGGDVTPTVYPMTGLLRRGAAVIRADYYLDAGNPVPSGMPASADGGTVTISTFGAGHVVGSFDARFDGTPLSGSFDAPFLVCP